MEVCQGESANNIAGNIVKAEGNIHDAVQTGRSRLSSAGQSDWPNESTSAEAACTFSTAVSKDTAELVGDGNFSESQIGRASCRERV